VRFWITLAVLALPLSWARTDDKTKGDDKPLTDQMFVDKAASSGMAEVAMGKLGQTMGQSDAVKQLGARMVEDHTKANQELMRTAADLKVTPLEKPLPEHEKHLKDLSGAAADFDKEYMHHMVTSHEEAVTLFTRASKELKNEQLRAFATTTLPVIQQHLKVAKEIQDKLGK
jgi:putative membrane protein